MAIWRRVLAIVGGGIAGWALGAGIETLVQNASAAIVAAGFGFGLGLGMLVAACIPSEKAEA